MMKEPLGTNTFDVLAILKRPHDERNEEDIEILVNYFKDISFLSMIKKENGLNALENLVGCLNAEEMEQGNLVFRHGDIGSKFYIIVEGKCSIMVPFL